MWSNLDVPYVPSPEAVVRRMLKIVDVKENETVYDLGAGDGRILLAAYLDFNAKSVGIELHDDRAFALAKRIARHNLQDSVKIVHDSFFRVRLSNANVVTMYLLPNVNRKIRSKLESELRPGARVVTHDFKVPGWRPEDTVLVDDFGHKHVVYLYVMPQA